MKRFRAGHTYEAADPGVPPITVIIRTPKSVRVTNGGGMWLMRIRVDADGNEYVIDSAVPRRGRDMFTWNAKWEER